MSQLYETDNPSFKKDIGSKAVVNTDLASFNRYKMEKAKRQELETMKNEVSVLKTQNTELLNQMDTLNTQMKELFALLAEITKR